MDISAVEFVMLCGTTSGTFSLYEERPRRAYHMGDRFVEHKGSGEGSIYILSVIAMSFDSDQFSSIPSRTYHCKMSKIKIPSNYDPVTRVYTGEWDGSFKTAYSNNPAWCFFDIVTNKEKGLGDRIPESSVDKAELYIIGKYCDELVPAADGSQEPRFTCNVLIKSREQAYKVVGDLASIFMGMLYYANGTIVPTQDRRREESEIAYAFTNANVIDGEFKYSGTDRTTRYNAVTVSWHNLKNFGKTEVEYVEDADLIASMGYVNDTSVEGIGCNTRGQARRVGKWIIYTNNKETETVEFVTGAEGAIPRPGSIVKVSDTLRASERPTGSGFQSRH